jgi:xanthine dehydrogenase YagS FAD-binding subunit
LRIADGVIQDARIVVGGVECVPRRLTVAEDIVKGSAQDEETAKLAGGSASRGATPLNYNQFKIPLLENLVTRAIRDA